MRRIRPSLLSAALLLLLSACSSTGTVAKTSPAWQSFPAQAQAAQIAPHRTWTVVLCDDLFAEGGLLERKGLRPENVEEAITSTVARLYGPFQIRFVSVRGARGKVQPVVAGGSLIEVVADAPPGTDPNLLGRAMLDPFDQRAEVLRADDPKAAFGIMGANIILAAELENKRPLDAAHIGKCLGLVIAHEVGHAIGLLHLPQYAGPPEPLVMLPSPGIGGILADQDYFWTHVEIGYLAWVLGLRR